LQRGRVVDVEVETPKGLVDRRAGLRGALTDEAEELRARK
jgi:hypothetical protein